MARMHARTKGKSSSNRPLVTENPEWVTTTEKEITDITIKLSKDGLSTAQIGLVLRDQYAVPNVKLVTGKSISDILVENDMTPALPEDLSNLMKRSINLNHLKENRGDIGNRRNLQLIESKIRRLERYYKRTGVLPSDWKYSAKTAELMLK
jgi:small subunit ribosomal protein S15